MPLFLPTVAGELSGDEDEHSAHGHISDYSVQFIVKHMESVVV